jgi:hypothetical protein
MSKKEKGGMRSATMPKDHFERKEKQAPGINAKYSSEFGNPHSLDKMTEGLAGYAKKNKMKYE